MELVLRCAMADKRKDMAERCKVSLPVVDNWRTCFYREKMSETQKARIYYHYHQLVSELMKPKNGTKKSTSPRRTT